MAQNDDKYNDPELRAEIKEKIHSEDRGGKSGQWSARKAQLLAAEYKHAMEKRGEEAYKTDQSQKSESQKSLSNWGEEDWQTSDGNGTACQEDGIEKRYLPRKTWESMTEEEKRDTNEKKMEGSREGMQYVENTEKAKEARKNTQHANSDKNKPRGTKHKLDEDGVNSGIDQVNGEDGRDSELKGGEKHKDTDQQPAAKMMKNNGGAKKITKETLAREAETDAAQAAGNGATDDGKDDGEYLPSGSEGSDFEFEFVSLANEAVESE